MLFALACLSLSISFGRLNILEFENKKAFSFYPNEIIQENLNDLLNDGINRTTFLNIFNRIPLFHFIYNRFIYFLTNENFTIHSNLTMKISPYFNTNQSLYSINPKLFEWFQTNKNKLIEFEQIISEIGPHYCTALNLDFDTLNRLYKYIFLNEENDGVLIEHIFDILQIPTDFIPQIAQVLSFFDNSKPVIELFEGLNVQSEYLNYIEKVRLLKIPENDEEKFFSFIHVIDAFSSFVDLINGIHKKFFERYEKEIINPILRTYLFKPIDIFDVPIFKRAIELNTTLNIIQNYSSYCNYSIKTDEEKDDDDDENRQPLKCKIYESIQSILSDHICDNDDDNVEFDEDLCEENVYENARSYVSDFTNPEVNFTQLFISKYHVPENYVKFAFGLIDNLTSKNKTYLDLLQGLTLVIPENKTVSIPHYHNVPFHTFVANITNLVNFIININDTSNFKLAFDYLNKTEQWNKLHYFVDQINQNKTLCDIKNMTENICNETFNSIVDIAKLLVSNKTLSESLSEKQLNYLIDGIIPLFKSIRLNVSQFVSGYYNLTQINSEKVQFVNFTLFIKTTGNLFDKIVTIIDENIPFWYKHLPIVGHRYHRFIHKSHEVFNVLKNDGKTMSLFHSLFGQLGVIAKMLSNGAYAYLNENTTIETFTKAIKPTHFLDVYQTYHKLSELKDLKIKSLVEAITYDEKSDEITFNNVFPIKTISQNANLLVNEMNENILNFKTVALSLGTEKEKLKYKLISFVKEVISPPYKLVKKIAINEGNDPVIVDQYLDKIRNYKNVTIKEVIDVKINAIQPVNENKKQLSSPVIIGIAIVAFVVASIIVVLTIYFVNKKNKAADNDYISQQTMLVD